MNNANELKQLLQHMKNNNWTIPDTIDINELTFTALDNISSLDEELRDYLILEMFEDLIPNHKISYTQMKKLLNLCLSDNHLFCGLGRINDDSVFNRTFSMLIIGNIIDANNMAEDKFLNKEEMLDVYKKSIDYCNKEIDYRGYVENKGWSHSSAHASDTLCSLAQSKYIGHDELIGILDVIKNKICIDNYTYINKEEERLINAFMYSYYRRSINNEEIKKWLYSFQDVKSRNKDFNIEHLRENRKKFFTALYFRVTRYKLDKDIIKTVEELLENYQQPYKNFNIL